MYIPARIIRNGRNIDQYSLEYIFKPMSIDVPTRLAICSYCILSF